jgi:hypothetical protein
MALPSSSDLTTLDIVYLGQPFVQVEAKALASTSLDIAYLGQPFVAIPVGLNVYVKISGVWKQAIALYVKISGTWKSVVTVSTRVSGVWKA